MKAKLVSLWNWFEIITVVLVSTLVLALVFVFTAPFDRLRKVTGRLFRICGTMLVRLNPLWSVKLTGYRRPKNSGPFIVVANHQSIADIPAISYVPWEMKWLSKESNFKVPGLGWMMSMAGDVPLRRGEKESAKSAMARCKWYLERGMSVMIFPEGTRSSDGEIKPFKDGAFRLALETGVPILPIAVAGSRHSIPKNSWVFGMKCQVRIEVLPPVEVKGMSEGDLDTLRDRVRNDIAAAFERLGKWAPTLPADYAAAKRATRRSGPRSLAARLAFGDWGVAPNPDEGLSAPGPRTRQCPGPLSTARKRVLSNSRWQDQATSVASQDGRRRRVSLGDSPLVRQRARAFCRHRSRHCLVRGRGGGQPPGAGPGRRPGRYGSAAHRDDHRLEHGLRRAARALQRSIGLCEQP